jgi:hypothetical protein
MLKNPVIKGASFQDERGSMRFINNFDMNEVVRFYEVMPKNTDLIRGWQAHKEEKKWFYCLQGSFIINLVKIDAFDNPSEALKLYPTLFLTMSPKSYMCLAVMLLQLRRWKKDQGYRYSRILIWKPLKMMILDTH